jgi:hypothetical protein
MASGMMVSIFTSHTVDEETFPSSANGKLTLILLDGSPVTELPSSSCANTRNSSHQSSKLLADKVWRRGRDSNSRPCDGRRFSRPVVSTAHPPLREWNHLLTRWRVCTMLFANVWNFARS